MTLRPTHALAAAIALAMSGVAMANTNINATTTGDVFINVVDTTNGTSFLYDTQESQATFLSDGTPQTFTFSGDTNYSAFVAAEGSGDVIDFSVLSAISTSASRSNPNGSAQLLFTSNAGPSAAVNINIGQATTAISAFLSVANQVTSSTTISALLGTAATWGQQAYEQTVDGKLGVPYTQPGSGVSALAGAGSSLAFYEETSAAPNSAQGNATLATLAGTWNYNNGVAVYSAPSAVPLPAPLALLVSGLLSMGLIGRRRASAEHTV